MAWWQQDPQGEPQGHTKTHTTGDEHISSYLGKVLTMISMHLISKRDSHLNFSNTHIIYVIWSISLTFSTQRLLYEYCKSTSRLYDVDNWRLSEYTVCQHGYQLGRSINVLMITKNKQTNKILSKWSFMDRWSCLLRGTLGLFSASSAASVSGHLPFAGPQPDYSWSPRRSVKDRSYIRLEKLVTPTGSFAEHPPVSALLLAAKTRPRHGEESHPPGSISHVVHGKGTIAAFQTWFN